MIRPYTPTDKPSLIALLKLNIPLYFAEAEEADFIEYLEQHLEDYFVVEEDNIIVGAGGINYFPDEKLVRISWDIVHPAYQGKGIGSSLMQHRINYIRKQPGVNLIVVRTTQLVYPFYQKMGFKLVKTERDYWAEGFDLYEMHMPLPEL
ncbi:GNAT family N-acetyltransferase [Pontibacter sp. KCTC 32443]|uniref:GNAT family N-acetyltransferase n=1 Tax=Pontibacter TaxID=323449 RepID=UPI00164DECCA|nr:MULTISPECIES: GNAT family N-acetyltransferase [Pontibacter]MBC5775486.1 GNAT family N-acetyltransferase [Pontibacter sp. KCTC 32443]